jgi:hypothetical protein
MIYTLCVEPIQSDLQAELHLYQFRTIIRILSKHWYFERMSPTTAVATWSRSNSTRFTIAFATTCSGDPPPSEPSQLRDSPSQIFWISSKDAPRYLLVILLATVRSVIVCRSPDKYFSIRVNLNNSKSTGHVATALNCRQLLHRWVFKFMIYGRSRRWTSS